MAIELKRLFDVLEHQRKNYWKEDCIAAKSKGRWVKYSTSDLIENADLVSLGLLEHGISRGDKVAIISMNRPEWNFVDLGILQLGAVNVPLYPTASVEDFQYILNHAEAKVLFVENADYLAKVLKSRDQLPHLKEIYTFERVEGTKHWTELTKDVDKSNAKKLQAHRDAVQSSDLASLIYTSGTTGTPKGVMLTHSNIISNVLAVLPVLPVDHTAKALSFLPLCHIFERCVNYVYLGAGVSIYYAESMDTIADNLKEVKPDFFTTVPRLLEKVYNKIVAKGEELTGAKRKLFFWALELGLQYESGKDFGPFYHLQLQLARKLIFSKWKEALGGNIRAIVSGGSALQPRLGRVFTAAGIPVLEGYGLTESSPVIAVNTLQHQFIGTVGHPLPGVQVKIIQEPGYRPGEGEICAKGPNIMQGYYHNPEATREAIDSEGWFRTGDIGMFVHGNYLTITDRKKEVFKTSGGKYIAPLHIEQKFKESLFVEQVMIVGENQRFPGALIVPNFPTLREWCNKHHLPYTEDREMIKNPKIIELFNKEIDGLNEHFGQTEKVKKIVLLSDEWTTQSGELTPKLSLKRRVLKEKYKAQIEEIYRE